MVLGITPNTKFVYSLICALLCTNTFSRTINYNKGYYKLQQKKWLPFPFFQKHYYIITFFTNSTFALNSIPSFASI